MSLILSVLFTFGIFLSVEPHFRVLGDETNLLGVSKSMLFDRTIGNVTQGKWYYFNFQNIEVQPPECSFLFPFFTYVLHLFFGYRTYHPFVLNFIVLVCIFSVVLLFMRKHYNFLMAVAALLLIAAQPVVTQTATSGTFDLIFAFWLLITLLSLARFLDNPSSEKFLLLWANLLLLANIRYEGPFYSVLVLFFLFWFGYVKVDFFRSSMIYALTPLVLLPTYWQRFLINANLGAPESVKTFSFAYFAEHLAYFFKSLFHFDRFLPYASLVNIVAVMAIIYFTVLFVFKKWPQTVSRRRLVLIAAFVWLLQWIILLSSPSNSLANGDGSRLWTFSFLTFSLLALLGLLYWIKKNRWVIFFFSLVVFGIYHPVSVKSEFFHTMVLPQEYRVILDFLNGRDHRNFLLVTYRPGIYTVHNYGAVSFHYANFYKRELLKELAEHLYREIYVIQEIDLDTGEVLADTKLDPEYPLDPLWERQIRVRSFTRLSRVVNFSEAPGAVSKPKELVKKAVEEQHPPADEKSIYDSSRARRAYALGHSEMAQWTEGQDNREVFRKANEHYQESIRLDPDYAEAHNSLAINYTFLGDFEKAVEHYRKALRINPAYATAKQNLELVINMMKKSKKEQEAFVRTLKYQVGES